jgi:hypothetical protein
MTRQTRRILQTISFLGLALSVLPAFLVFGGVVSKQTHLYLMVLGMVMWFGTATFWIRRDHLGD